MSHELTIRHNGQVEMAYAGLEQPWHGLGTRVEDGATIDTWIKSAGMDWSIVPGDLTYMYQGEATTLAGKKVLYRSDTGLPLGLVSDSYKIVQPWETLEFFRDLIHSLGLEMTSAGTLFGGRKFWASAYIGEEAVVTNQDVIRQYVLLSTSSDGSLATTGRFTTTRVVCRNTLSVAHSESKAAVRVLHSTEFRADEAKKAMGLAPNTLKSFMDNLRHLAETQVTNERCETLLEELGLGDRAAKRVTELFAGEAIGANLAGCEQTGWGWLNAITQYVDHDRRGKTPSHQMNSAMFGRGDAMKTRALELALAC